MGNINIEGECAKISQCFYLAFHVVSGGPKQHAQKGNTSGGGKPTNNAEVEQCGSAIGEHEEIAAMKVAVEDAHNHCAFHEGDHACTNNGLGVETGCLHAFDVVEVEAV